MTKELAATATPINTLLFDETNHRYFAGGIELPSVTRILRYGGLLDYDFLSAAHRKECLERGRAVHVATQQNDEGRLDEENLDAEVLGYLQGWRAFRRDYGFKPLLVEHRVCNLRRSYAGCLDRVGLTRDGCEWVLDIKTGAAPDATRYQLSAYAACMKSPRSLLRRAVELHQDGSYRVIAFETSDYLRDLKTFLTALYLFKTREDL
jgi:hypothetical protein